jgi:hypothetical protein
MESDIRGFFSRSASGELPIAKECFIVVVVVIAAVAAVVVVAAVVIVVVAVSDPLTRLIGFCENPILRIN